MQKEARKNEVHMLLGAQGPAGSSSRELGWDPGTLGPFPRYFNRFHSGGEGEATCTNHNSFMQADVSLPPGIMRDRALAERDFVTFPEIFFFSVLSKRCRAMWEAGSLDGLEELSVLSTHSLRPFI